MIRYVLFLSITLLSCTVTKGISKPFGQDDLLPMASPQSVRMKSSYLDNISQQIAKQDRHKLHSLLILRDGKLVFEEYYNGYTRETPHDIRSATKSITSLLTGIALARNVLANIDTPMMDYLRSSYPDIHNKDDISIRHLLTMSAGLDCHDRDRSTRGQEDRMYRSKDWVHYFLKLSRTYPVGEKTLYCTGGVVALGEAIAQASGKDMAMFAKQFLFAPLGIKNYQWARFDDGKKVDTGGHLLITPQGMAKIGLLVLQRGRWQNQQIVPSEWIQLSTEAHTRSDNNLYGFLWWISIVQYGKKDVKVIMARGNGGQAIFVVPEFDLVAVSTTGYYNSDKARIPFELFFQAILPSVEEMQPYLPKQPDS